VTGSEPREGRAGAVDFACGECSARMTWVPERSALVCAYCGTQRAVEPGDAPIGTFSLDAPEAARTGLGLATQTAVCGTCGARVAFGDRDLARTCVFCGASGVLEEREHRNAIRPGSLVPLEVGRERVEAAFRRWARGRWFAPGPVRRMARFDAVGVYLPFWLFDCRASSRWTAEAGHYYYVTVPQTVMRNGRPTTVMRRERRTRWEPAAGRRHDVHEDLRVLASRGIDGGLERRLGRFELAALVPYRPDYLSGWAAEEYQVPLEAGWSTAEALVRATQRARCSGDVPGDTQRNLVVSTVIGDVRWRLALLPVWSLSYAWKGRTFPVLVNGQTGRVAGRAPTSWLKVVLLILVIAAVITTIVLLSG